MKINIGCDNAKFNAQMRIICTKINDLCGHQRFKPCKGWCVLTEGAKDCTLKKEKENA